MWFSPVLSLALEKQYTKQCVEEQLGRKENGWPDEPREEITKK
jgi:hypothetical protein